MAWIITRWRGARRGRCLPYSGDRLSFEGAGGGWHAPYRYLPAVHAEVKVVKEVEEVFVARKSPHVARALSRASRRWPTDFLIHEASRGARAMGATRRYAGMRLEIEQATSEDAAERQHAELGAARPGRAVGKGSRQPEG